MSDEPDPILRRGREIIELEIAELERRRGLLDLSFTQAVEALHAAVRADRKILVAGVGKSGNIGPKIAATLNSTGAAAVVLDTQNALHGDMGLVHRDDVVLALSQSGETGELLDLLPHLKRRGARLIALTGNPDSSLARHSEIVLDTGVEREACPLNLAPTSSTTVMLVLADALAMVLLERRGFRSEDFAELHPGGSLGRVLLTRVADVMRGGDRLPVVSPEATVAEALALMTRHRSGLAAIVDAEGRLAGVFTHGDFIRAWQGSAHVGTEPVGSLMSADPVTIGADRLATEALQRFERHEIDELVVVDADARPVGIVDTQDLSRMQLV